MSKQIEDLDRSVTITKSLAWTIISGLVLGSLWLGTSIAALQTTVESLSEDRISFRNEIKDEIAALAQRDNETLARVRYLEQGEVRDAARIDEMSRILQRIDERLSSIDQRLRETELTP